MKILLTQTAFLGDVVLATPIIELLRQQFPNDELHFLTTKLAAELFTHDPRLTRVHVFPKRQGFLGMKSTFQLARDLREEGFAKVYSLHKSARSSMLHLLSGIPSRTGFADATLPWAYHERVRRPKAGHSVERNSSLVSSDVDLPPLSLYPPPFAEVSEPIRKAFESDGSFVLMIPGSAWRTKQWDWYQYHRLASLLTEQGKVVWLTGSQAENELCERVRDGNTRIRNWSGQGSIQDLLWMMSVASGVVCNDSFALHVAAAFQRPTAAVFCATSPSFGFGPWKNPHARVVQKIGLWCKPCRRHGGRQCPTGTEACMRGVMAEEVFEVLSRLIAVANCSEKTPMLEVVGSNRV